MKTKTYSIFILLILICGSSDLTAAQKAGTKKPANTSASVTATEKEEFDAAVALPAAERIVKLKAFIQAHPRSSLKTRALELMVSAYASLGEERLIAGDAASGIEQFRLAIATIPAEMSTKLYTDVVSKIPSNLFLRGQQAAALESAHLIEARVKDDAIRLLTITAFYLGIEATDDAMRTAELAIKLAPELSAAYQARASARRIALQLEESAADYARALELDPKSEGAMRSVAELRRATGKTEEALNIYRELLKIRPADEFARTGLILSLFELGRREEAEREFDAALKENPTSLVLLTGAAYWFAAHNEAARAVEFGEKAVQLEPRYTWGHIALARGLLQQKRAIEAERPLLVARQYGKFPTLDYEMASVMFATGLYGEAAATLSTSFALKQDLIEAYLAGRVLTQATNFTELLAPERRASIFQYTAADNEASARSLKALLVFSTLLASSEERKEADVLAAARDFVSGDDDMRAFRRLYVAGQLLDNNFALSAVLEMMDAVTSDVDKALAVPTASTAVMAEELRDTRAQAFANGRTVTVPAITRNTLANIVRGRIEDLAGWALFRQGNFTDALLRLRRATSVLPEGSVWWRNSMWHLGASLDANGKGAEALEAYYSSYKSGGPDPTRHAVIANLYRRVNGSLDGLEDKIGPPPVLASNIVPPAEKTKLPQTSSAESRPVITTTETKPTDTAPKTEAPLEQKVETTETKPAESGAKSEVTPEQKIDSAESKPPDTTPAADAPIEQKVESTEAKPAEVEKTNEVKSEPKTEPAKLEEPSPPPPTVAPTPEPTPTPTPEEVPLGPPQRAVDDEKPSDQANKTSTTETKPAATTSDAPKQRRRRVSDSKCTITASESALTIENNGGRAIIGIALDGSTSTDGVTASTSDWSALAVFPEPKNDNNTANFSITSISKKTGMFTVSFKTPCGSKDVIVTVR